MEACPKCNFALTPDAAECPACGVVLAKLRPSSSLPRPAGTIPPPFRAVPSNPYAPPMAQIEGLPVPPPAPLATVPAQDVITPMTLSALVDARPWIRFLVIYGFVMVSLTLLGAVGLLLFSTTKPEMMTLALVYLFYGIIALALVMPLHRSTQALGRLALHGASTSASLETFAIEQSAFWRRSGLLCVVSLIVVLVLVVIMVFAGVAAPR